ncbi:hypothetical protein [Pedobacter panaciterrae]
MITNHQYLFKFPIDPSAEKLILGTIHPHNHEKFLMQFFYGNELSLWKIFHNAFPSELPDPGNLRSVLVFLKNRKLTVSDTIISCKRLNPTALDEDLIPIKLNGKALKEGIMNSSIKEVLCTSGFNKNNAFKLFYCDILGLKLTSAIRKAKEIDLPLSIFGRPVKLRFIYSPSAYANRGIGNSPGYKVVREVLSVDQYRVTLYKKAFDL